MRQKRSLERRQGARKLVVRASICRLGHPGTKGGRAKIMARKPALSIITNRKKKANSANKNQRSAGKPDVELGKRIRLRRVEIDISQTELGEKLGVSFQQVQKYEKGVNRVGAARLQQIATALDVPVTFFYDGDGKEREVESLLFIDSGFSLRLLRAYSKIKDQAVKRQFVSLIENIAANE